MIIAVGLVLYVLIGALMKGFVSSKGGDSLLIFISIGVWPVILVVYLGTGVIFVIGQTLKAMEDIGYWLGKRLP